MEAFLRPQYFKQLCEPALKIAKLDDEDDEERARSSNAIKIGFDLGRMIDVLIGQTMQSQNRGDQALKEKRDECYDLMWLMKKEWSSVVKKQPDGC